MAKARKSAKKKTARKGKTAKRRKAARSKKTRRAKPKAGVLESAISAAEEAAALRRRLAGRNTFED